MPFRSQAQRAYFHQHLPDLAAEWEKGTPKGLPEHVATPVKRPAYAVQPVTRPTINKPAVRRR